MRKDNWNRCAKQNRINLAILTSGKKGNSRNVIVITRIAESARDIGMMMI